MAADIRTLECYNIQCRVVRFKGVIGYPLGTCPDCHHPGAVLPDPKIEEKSK